MAQARRKSPARKSRPAGSGGYLAGIVLLLAGMVVGSLATILWQGAQTADAGVGAGIRRIVENVNQPPAAGAEVPAGPQAGRPERPSLVLDFYKYLPEIEVPVPPAASPPAATRKQPDAHSAPAARGGAYMLQVASYRRRADADRLKATLALDGIVSAIQKVSIQGQGDFYRVRLGPYGTYDEMERVERRLGKAGIKVLRLKVSGAAG